MSEDIVEVLCKINEALDRVIDIETQEFLASAVTTESAVS